MCLNPIKINPPFKRIAVEGGQPLKIEVPCGKCAECKKAKRLEWHFRTYYECESCVKKGGFIYFDTLTYAPEHLPHLSHFLNIEDKDIADFSCFNNNHWRLFLKNLRRQLYYHHKGVNFKYFLTSEYGLDDRYTHRPHYHILFFVDSKKIHPFEFSKLVSKCWQFGITDGLPHKNPSYVAEHVFGYDLLINQDKNNYLKVSNYVSKYITKDSTFQETLNNRIELLRKHFAESELIPVIRNIGMFHRQSQGFGISYINNLDDEEMEFIKKNNACRIKDSKKVTLVIPIPTYYTRKLFYECLKDDDGCIYWRPTYDGVQHIRRTAINSINKTIKVLTNTINNFSEQQQALISHSLGNRTLEDYAIYKLFYCGRCRELTYDFYKHYHIPINTLTDDEYNLYDWIERILFSKFINTQPDIYFFEYDRENDTLYIPSNNDIFDEPITINYSRNLKNFTFNENSCRAFENFDKLTSYIKLCQKLSNNQKQKTFEFIEDLSKKFKVLYYG